MTEIAVGLSLLLSGISIGMSISLMLRREPSIHAGPLLSRSYAAGLRESASDVDRVSREMAARIHLLTSPPDEREVIAAGYRYERPSDLPGFDPFYQAAVNRRVH